MSFVSANYETSRPQPPAIIFLYFVLTSLNLFLQKQYHQLKHLTENSNESSTAAGAKLLSLSGVDTPDNNVELNPVAEQKTLLSVLSPIYHFCAGN